MDVVRIGNKVVSKQRIDESINQILSQRQQGASQKEAADACRVDRSFVSWLEKLGEIRKGGRIAVIGFPVANTEELKQVAVDEGVEFTMLMTDGERREYARSKTGEQLLNEIMRLIGTIRKYDAVVFLASDQRLQIMKALVDTETIGIELGRSPLGRDVWLCPEQLRECIRSIKR